MPRRDPSLLYEVSLAVGASLEPVEAARIFGEALVEHLGLAGVRIWVREGARDLYTHGPQVPTEILEASREGPAVEGDVLAFPLREVGALGLRCHHPFDEEEAEAFGRVVDTFAVCLRGALAHERLQQEIEDRTSAEAASRIARERMVALLRANPNATLVETAERRVMLANQAFCDLFGIPVPPESLVGVDCAAAAEDTAALFADPQAFLDGIDAVLAARETVTGEVLALADGRVLERDYVPIALDGDYAGHLWEYRDATARRQAAMKVDQLRQFYEAVLESMPAQLAVFDPDGRYRYVTPSAIADPERRAAVIGTTDEEYALMRGLPPEIPRRRMQTIRDVAEAQASIHFEESFRARDGTMRHFVRFVTPVVDESGETVQVLGYGLDITERKAAEEALATSEALKRGVFESALDAVITIDREGRIIEFNPAAEATFGHRAADVIGEQMADLIVPERLRSAHRAGMERYLATGEGPVLGTRIEVPALRADGSEFSCELAINPVRLDDDREVFTATLRDITERKAAEEALAESEGRYKQLVENSEELIYRADLAGCFTYANAVAAHRTGYPEADLIGMSFWDLVAPGHRQRVVDFYARQVAEGVPNTFLEFPIRTREGETLWIGQNVQLLTEDGAPTGVQAVARDVTERRRVMDQLVAARETAERASRAREEFLANMSHEMRTPLNAVIGMGELLGETALDEEQRHLLGALSFSADQLLALINDLLDVAKIESGQIRFERVPFRLDEVVEGVVETVRFRADEKGLDLSLGLAPEAPRLLIGDPVRLSQILLNLLSNAVKFTERGRVRLAVALTDEPSGDGAAGQATLRFIVEDTGVGIPASKLGSVFERFTQARSDTTRRFGGTGLGLAIVKELTERQGGTVHVESTEGRGSTFTATLSFALAESAPEAPDGEEADLTGARLLLVEDNPLNQFVARRMLEGWGAEIEVAENGREAVEAVEAAHETRAFDLVLMDIQMPEMDGFEATRRIRQRHASEALPILALTASALVEQRDQMDAAGMDGLVLKPFKPAHLRRVVAAHLGRSDAPPAEPLAAESIVDLTLLEENLDGDHAFILRLLDLFEEVVPESIRTMEVALATDDLPGLATAAHKLKSSAGILGIGPLHALLSEVERMALEGQTARLPETLDATVATTAAALDEFARLRPTLAPAAP
ncbi:MAG: PAS domain S-box protein [Bacteroidota bacterium]